MGREEYKVSTRHTLLENGGYMREGERMDDLTVYQLSRGGKCVLYKRGMFEFL